jgi:hypothetical protein
MQVHTPKASPQMNRALAGLIAAVSVAGVGVLAVGAARHTGGDLRLLLIVIGLGALAERYAIGLFNSEVSMGMAAVLVAAVIAGPWGVALVAPPVAAVGQIGSSAAWYKRLYNAGVYLLSGVAFWAVFAAFDMAGMPDEWPRVLVPALLAAAVNYAVNTGLVALAIALSEDEPPFEAWRRRFAWLGPHYLAVGLSVIAAASAYHVLGVWALAVFAAPLAGIRHAYFHAAKAAMDRQTELPRAA